MNIPDFPTEQARALLGSGLLEDTPLGDATTEALGEMAKAPARAEFVAKFTGIIAGLPLIELASELAQQPLTCELKLAEGSSILEPPTPFALWQGPANQILTLERLTLNLLQYLSGIATHTAQCVAALKQNRADSPTQILDTRKTLPGYRRLAKYAVALGGGVNHRMSLSDAIMIKDNHVAMAGSVEKALAQIKSHNAQNLKVIVEVDRPDQVAPAVNAGAKWLLLDNMTNQDIQACQEIAANNVTLEVSGGVTLPRLAELGELGVNYVSMGALTHSVMAADIGLDLRLQGTN